MSQINLLYICQYNCCIFRLGTVLILVDGVTGLNETDMIGLNMLEEFGIPYTVSERVVLV